MRHFAGLMLLMLVAGASSATQGRDGGETIETAVVIPGDVGLLPYQINGSTCGHVDDYEGPCDYPVTGGPDLVYSFTPSQDIAVSVNLCASTYDAVAYIYDSTQTVIACNSNGGCSGYGLQAYIYGALLTGGQTYYIVIDGREGACGAYDLILEPRDACVVACPAGAQQEGEPPCQDDYLDEYNGGCWGPNQVWSQIVAGADGCATICGKSCTYEYHGAGGYRDTDWYEAVAAGGPVTFTCEAEFPLDVCLDPFLSCNMAPEGNSAYVAPCTPVEIPDYCTPGQRLWWFVSTSTFEGVPEADYVFTVCGLMPPTPTPVETTSWGRLKARYRDGAP